MDDDKKPEPVVAPHQVPPLKPAVPQPVVAANPPRPAPLGATGVVQKPDPPYGILADAVREAANHEGHGTFTVKNHTDRSDLIRLLSGSPRKRAVVVDPKQEERVMWKAAEAE